MNYTTDAAISSTQLKRNRPPPDHSHPEPPLPKVTSDLVLQVFTHVSLRRTGRPEDYGDNERLIQLGTLVLEAAATYALFNKRPIRTTQEILAERDVALSDANLNRWVTMYSLRQKLRCHPDIFPYLSTPKETRSLFCAYVGGVYVENGIETVQEWISHLLSGQDNTAPLASLSEQQYPQPIEPPSKKVKSEQPPPYHSTPIFFASQPPPSPPKDKQRHLPPHMHSLPPLSQMHPSLPVHPLPHVPQTMPLPNPLAPAQPSLPFLPLFNQTATQRRVVVEYPAEFNGPPHAGQWTVRCVVNGIQKGLGMGASKQIAKEEAARQAYYAMGWT